MNSWKLVSCVGLFVCFAAACTQPPPPPPEPTGSVEKQPFGETPEGIPVELCTLTNASGVEVRAMTYGGIILTLRVPDRDGNLGDVVLGYDTLDGYLEVSPYFGAIIGRYGNRIGGAKFTLDGDNVVMFLTAQTHEGTSVDVTFRGTLSGDDVSGQVEYDLDGDTGSFGFTGRRKS